MRNRRDTQGSANGHRISSPVSLRLVEGTADRRWSERKLSRLPSRGGGVVEKVIRVVIAERQGLVRAGYRALLETEDQIAVTGEAGTVDDAIAVTADSGADIVLLDLGLPDLSTLGAPARIISQRAFANAAVILIAPDSRDERVYNALRGGAVGVLAKDVEPQDLIRAVHAVARGEALLSVETMRHLLSEPTAPLLRPRPLSPELDELTDRERELMGLAAAGLTNAEIADHLVISRATAKTHVSRAMFKLGLHNRAQLVVFAYEAGLVQPRDVRVLATDRERSVETEGARKMASQQERSGVSS